ncbi:MAG TPA: sugar phosphate isomerase/epimerase [Abditibacteriaceae bacterium]|jgi:sugar phosphate isomerase/epimerase
MSRPPIAVQLYTLRDLTSKDMAGTLARVAELGYEGIEFAGYGNLEIEAAQRAAKEAGLKVVGNHVGFDALRNNFNKVIDDSLLLDNKYLVCPSLPGEQRTKEGYAAFGKELEEMGARANSAGMTLCYHNHDFEFEQFDGEYGLDLLYANSQPQLVQAEIDTFWVKKGGADPATYIRQYSGRVPLLHIKDMGADGGFAEVGNGSLDWPSIFAAAEEAGVTAYIVEQDTCPGDPMDSIRQSIENLKNMGKLA